MDNSVSRLLVHILLWNFPTKPISLGNCDLFLYFFYSCIIISPSKNDRQYIVLLSFIILGRSKTSYAFEMYRESMALWIPPLSFLIDEYNPCFVRSGASWASWCDAKWSISTLQKISFLDFTSHMNI